MGFFDSKKTTWRKLNQTTPPAAAEYNQLKAQVGKKAADDCINIIYTHYVKNGTINIPPDLVQIYLMFERQNFLLRRQFFTELIPRTSSGELGALLNANLRPESDYYKTRTGNLVERELAIDKAANWICGGFVAGIPATKAILSSYIPSRAGDHGKTGAGLGSTASHIKSIHKKLLPHAPKTRFGYAGGNPKYPTTASATILLDEIFNLVGSNANWPPFGDAHWESIAMFYMSAIITVQGFSDGNKRTGHMAYAIILIKGTHDFKAPTTAVENQLFRMKGV